MERKKYYIQPYVAHTYHAYTIVPGSSNRERGRQTVCSGRDILLEQKKDEINNTTTITKQKIKDREIKCICIQKTQGG